MAAILHPKRSDASMSTSTAIEVSPGVPCHARMPGAWRRWLAVGLAFPAIAWFGRVDAEGLPEAPPSQWRDDDGVAALHPFRPAEIEVALGERGPDRTRDVGAPLGPIEAEPANVAAGRTQCAKLDPELGEETPACGRDFSGFVVEL